MVMKRVMEIDEKVMETCDETFKIPRYLSVPRVRRSRGIRGRGFDQHWKRHA